MKDLVFYSISGAVIAGIAQLLGASLTVIIFASILIPPLILLVIRIRR
ncbi:MAG: hypothetical protein AABZ77_09690 [Chloroflexota bacterium]